MSLTPLVAIHINEVFGASAPPQVFKVIVRFHVIEMQSFFSIRARPNERLKHKAMDKPGSATTKHHKRVTGAGGAGGNQFPLEAHYRAARLHI
jgi:hypothetical protein